MWNWRSSKHPDRRWNQQDTGCHRSPSDQDKNIIASIIAVREVIDHLASAQQARHNQNNRLERAKAKRDCFTILALLSASAVAVWGILQSHSDTSRALRDARETATQQHADTLAALAKTDDTIAAMKDQAGILRNQLSEMQNAQAIEKSRLQARFKMAIELGHFGSQYGFTPKWTNTGATDGLDLWMWDKIQIFGPDIPQDFACPIETRPKGASIGSVAPTDEKFQATAYLGDDDVMRVVSGEGTILFWGYIEYKDVFDAIKMHRRYWADTLYPYKTVDNAVEFRLPFIYPPQCNHSD